MPTRPLTLGLALGLVIAAFTQSAAADLNDPVHQWLPSEKSSTWTWRWSDSGFVKQPIVETYTVAKTNGPAFQLGWTTTDQTGRGTVDYQRTDAGLVNTDWAGTAPPTGMPILCATTGQCGNSLAGAHFQLIWGTRSPVLLEPLVKGASWSSLGGANSDVASDNRYLGKRTVKVPAFPQGVQASAIESEVNQAGALGDPYGSGVRTTYWVFGVGPVLITFRHTGGEITTAQLMATNLKPQPAPPDADYFPLTQGAKAEFTWRNSKWMKSPSRQRFSVDQIVHGTARVNVKQVSGPIRVSGSYVFTQRLDGLTALQGVTRSASLAKFPALGPSRVPASQRRHMITPYDLMAFGFNPIMPAYAAAGQKWKSDRASRDYRVFGVTGEARVTGIKTVRVPAGRFKALAVVSRLKQAGFPFGSGTRTSYFAAGRGLVKLVFRHGDGSVSTVERVK
jgi:hypothetical protein